MGLFNRIKRVTTGRLELFLAKSDSPEVIFPLLIAEMEDQVRAATDAEAKALAVLKRTEQTLNAVRDQWESMTRGARLALENEQEGMAREAVEAQVVLEAEIIRCEAALELAEEALAEARSSRQQSQHQLLQIRGKKDEILSRARIVRSREKLERIVFSPVVSTGCLLEEVAAMEARIAEHESGLTVGREQAGMATTCSRHSLDHRMEDLRPESEVDRRMAELKQKHLTRG